MVHTEFVLKCKNNIWKGQNTVSSQFPIEFGKGVNLFKYLTISYQKIDNDESYTINVPIEHLSTTYIGNGEVCFALSASVNLEEQINVKEIAISSETNNPINNVTPNNLSLQGEIYLCINAYMQLQGDIIYSQNPEIFFDYLVGLKSPIIKAGITNGQFDYNLANLIVNAQYIENKIVLSWVIITQTNGKYLAIYADGQPVFMIATTNTLTEQINATCNGNILPVNPYNSEAKTQDGTIPDTIKARNIGLKWGESKTFYAPYYISCQSVQSSPNGNQFAVKHKYGITLFVKNDENICNKYLPKNALFPYFNKDNIKSFCFNSTKLYILSDTFCAVDSSNGNLLAEYQIDQACNRVFATDDCVIITDSDGFGVYLAGDTLAMQKYVYHTDATYAFDYLTSTLTVFLQEGKIKQYVFSGTNYTHYEYALQYSFDMPTEFDKITARFGMIAFLINNKVIYYDLINYRKGEKEFEGFVFEDEGATKFICQKDGIISIYRLDNEFVLVDTLESTANAAICNAGIITDDCVIMPVTESTKRFEIISNTTVTDTYLLITNTPYFSEGTKIINLEAIV